MELEVKRHIDEEWQPIRQSPLTCEEVIEAEHLYPHVRLVSEGEVVRDYRLSIVDVRGDANVGATMSEEEPKRGKDCPEDPERLKGAPIGMYHCPECGMMLLAGSPHPEPSELNPDIYMQDEEQE